MWFPQKFWNKLANVDKFHHRNPELRLDPQGQKTISLLNAITISLNIQIDKFVYRFDLETKTFCFFPIKKFELQGNQMFLPETVNFNHRQIHYLYFKNRNYVANNCEIFESNYDVAHSPFFVGLKTSLLFSLGTCIFQKQSVRVNFSCTKRIFDLPAEVIIKVRNARLYARCAIFFLKIKQIPFSCRLAEGFAFLKRVQNQFKMVLEMCIFQASIVLTERNAILLTVM